MFDIDKLENKKIWVEHPKGYGDRYLIKYIPSAVIKMEIARDESRKQEKNYNENAPDGWVTRIVCQAVVDWEGLVKEGKPWPCTDENKQIFFSTYIEWADFILMKCRDEKLFFGNIEEELKN